MRLVKWDLKAEKELDVGEETSGRRSGPEVRDRRARMKGNAKAKMGTRTREGRKDGVSRGRKWRVRCQV